MAPPLGMIPKLAGIAPFTSLHTLTMSLTLTNASFARRGSDRYVVFLKDYSGSVILGSWWQQRHSSGLSLNSSIKINRQRSKRTKENKENRAEITTNDKAGQLPFCQIVQVGRVLRGLGG